MVMSQYNEKIKPVVNIEEVLETDIDENITEEIAENG